MLAPEAIAAAVIPEASVLAPEAIAVAVAQTHVLVVAVFAVPFPVGRHRARHHCHWCHGSIVIVHPVCFCFQDFRD